MRTIFLFLISFFLLSFSAYCQAIIEISNPIKVNREEVVAIPWKDILSVYPDIDIANFIIINPKTKQQAIYQLEYRGTKEIQNLLIKVMVAAETQLQLQKGKPEKFVSKTYSRYVPERKDDFAWENDKIAFRMYGKAPEGTKENAYGTDVWVKRTDKLIINERYKRAEYHIDHGDGIKELAKKGQIIEKPTDTLKHHTVLEFLDLREDERYTESDLENAIISKIEHFMLELGKGFLFEGRQKRFSFEGDSFFVDLVLYNRLLKCYVLIDLKIGRLTHQDIGQMQMYVNYYDRKIKVSEENSTIGIILCKEENKAVVEFTLPQDNKTIFAKEYKLYLPSKDQLKKQLE
jgi:predicted nuclease of restriction endonuclease-like (RecB) superfamily